MKVPVLGPEEVCTVGDDEVGSQLDMLGDQLGGQLAYHDRQRRPAGKRLDFCAR